MAFTTRLRCNSTAGSTTTVNKTGKPAAFVLGFSEYEGEGRIPNTEDNFVGGVAQGSIEI